MSNWLERAWQQGSLLLWVLAPFTLLFIVISGLRRWAYSMGLLKSVTLPVPVIVVGNLSVGGNGKTPVVLYLIELLQAQGKRVGVISRGYGGEADNWPQWVASDTPAALVGDEPRLIVQRTGVPMAVGPDRIAAAQMLLERAEVDVILSDDGLQHYRLGRKVELVVVDGERRFGNGYRLPMGPLREPVSRLASVDLVICNGGTAKPGEYSMQLQPLPLRAVDGSDRAFDADRDIVAMAGIGHPPRFFTSLENQGLMPVRCVPFDDHHPYTAPELRQLTPAAETLLMTEKDAVKCRAFAQPNWFYLPVAASLSKDFDGALLSRLKE
ncbi:tetraacyldisaccharide 4'-kinase [Ferrimonas sp. SCSIO 43195]|uniref:tetraacyldisaccharide 4'-kinase n=1 Tax=Ferrimonas sp. SCSIO 43195 TaxID=2822844 RepID=UPI002075929C|nr:tetraacyldisaccharide 4'-kinase [Ferrimonas sp. SCSIO 43195]USD38773.1 tetraacyldisaccharide 4'-kinase [Ferrimonas sp. SCSIO 43195]